MPFGQHIQGFPGNELLRDLPLEPRPASEGNPDEEGWGLVPTPGFHASFRGDFKTGAAFKTRSKIYRSDVRYRT
jgi:hypothetical protein